MSAAKFVSVCAQGDGVGRVIAQIEDPDGNFLASWLMKYVPHNGRWVKFESRKLITSIAIAEEPALELAGVGPDGHCVVLDVRGSQAINVGGQEDATLMHGFLREIRCVKGVFFCCGMGRQVYRREVGGRWGSMHSGILADPADPRPLGLNSIHGSGPDDLFAVGFGGEIWHWNGMVWRILDSPTNLTLHQVLYVGPDHVYACGKNGILLRYQRQGWQVLPQDEHDTDFRSLAWFDDRLYVTTGQELLVLDGDGRLNGVTGAGDLGLVDLSVKGRYMWGSGPNVVAFAVSGQATSWTRVTPPL